MEPGGKLKLELFTRFHLYFNLFLMVLLFFVLLMRGVSSKNGNRNAMYLELSRK